MTAKICYGKILSMSKLSVLAVDDEPDILDLINDTLSPEGYQVTTVSDPREALTKIRDEIFHVVLLDLMMPIMSGMELLAKIREIDDDIAVIILTAYPSYETAQNAIAYDVSAYIEKGNFREQYREQIARIVKRKGIVLRSDGEVLAVLGQRIRNLRRDGQLTLRQLSRRTSLSVSLLSQIERAESSASVSSLVKISSALNVSIADLFTDDSSDLDGRPRRSPTEDSTTAQPPPA
ncbi:MAG: response regulator [Kofleriaceae bacterium]